MKKITVRHIILFLLLSFGAHAQQSAKYSYSLGGEVLEGFILRHHESIGYLIHGRPTGISLNLLQHTYGNKPWESIFNYPDVAFSLSYYDLKNNAELGKMIAVSSGMAFHLLGRPPFKSDLQFFLGLGLGYCTNPYDHDTNNMNTLISSTISYNGNFKLAYYYHVNRFEFGVGIKGTHFSNGGIKKPNLGLNFVSLDLEMRYRLTKDEPDYLAIEQKLGIDKRIHWGGTFRIGWMEPQQIGAGSMPVYSLAFLGQKRLSLKSQIDFGVEGFMNKGIAYEVLHGPPIGGEPDYKRIGVLFGHELLVNKLAVVTHLGFYVYKPYYPNERFYMRVGLNYYFNKHLYASFALKTHFAVAELFEYGIRYRF